MKQRFNIFGLLLLVLIVSSCGGVNKIYKSSDPDFKYEMAKQCYAQGQYNNAAFLLNDIISSLKGTEKGDESLFLYAMSKYKAKDYITANEYFKKYYQAYPTSTHVDEARFYAAMALVETTPLPELDQTDTYNAITELQNFLEISPDSKYAPVVRKTIFEQQDKLIEKEYLASKLYFNLGNYFGN